MPKNRTIKVVDYRSVNLAWLLEFRQSVFDKELAPSCQLVVAVKDYGLQQKHGFRFQKGDTLLLKGVKKRLFSHKYVLTKPYGEVHEGEVPVSLVEAKPRNEWTTEDVCEYVVKPACMELNSTYLEVMPGEAVSQQEYAGAFVSQARKCRFADLVGALENYFTKTGKKLSEQFVWLDVFCANQPKLTSVAFDAETQKENEAQLTKGLHVAIANFDMRVMFIDKWDEPATISRAWCVWELLGVAKAGKTIGIALTTREHERYIAFMTRDFFNVISKLVALDTSTATCFSETDLAMIRTAIETESSFDEVNDLVASQLRSWVISSAEEELAEVESKESPDLHRVGLLASCIGLTYEQQLKFDKARPMLEKALDASKEKYGPRNTQTVTALGNLGILLDNMGLPKEALPLAEEALEIAREIFNPDHKMVALALNNLGLVLLRTGPPKRAETVLRESLELSVEIHGRDHAAVATTMNNLASLLQTSGKKVEELEMRREVVRILAISSGKNHPRYGMALGSLASSLFMNNMQEEAIVVMKERVQVAIRVNGRIHAQVAKSMNSLASLMSDVKGKDDETLRVGREALRIGELTLNPNDWELTNMKAVWGEKST